MTRTKLSNTIRANWPAIVERSRCRAEALDALPSGPLRILGSSLKTEKGEGRGILTAVVYMAPATSSGREICPSRTPACTACCLGEHAGRMRFDQGVKRAQLWKTALRFGDPSRYFALLQLDIATHEAKARKLGMTPAVRLDGTSDLGDAERMAPLFPGGVFYDYTKVVTRLRRPVKGWHRTLSYSGTNRIDCFDYLSKGGNVAVPFASKDLPTEWFGFPVINGDESDYRPGDPPGSVVGLSWKGGRKTLAIARELGWVTE